MFLKSSNNRKDLLSARSFESSKNSDDESVMTDSIKSNYIFVLHDLFLFNIFK